jgi:steroid delta-isomerase-like uncharacterized protein
MDAFNRHDAAAFASAYAPDAVVYDPQYPQPLKGRDSIREDIDAFFTAFPDITGSVGRVLEKDDLTAFEGSFKGTNKGPLKLPEGDLPPTNRPVSLTGAIFVRFNSKGQIEEERRYMDIGAMMTQLGLGPEGQA